MKIFFCDNRLGGLLSFRVNVIQHFVDDGHEVTLLAPKATSEWDKVGEKVDGIRIIEIPMSPSTINPIKDFQLIFFLLRLYLKEKPDSVFNFTIKPNIYSCLAGKIAGAQVFDMLAGLGYIFNGNGVIHRIGRRLYRFSLSMADHVFTLNEGNRSILLEKKFVSPSKLILLKGGEGINLQTYPHIPINYNSDVRFLVISRVLKDKGYMEFTEASRIVREKYPNVKMEWLGPWDHNSPMGVEESTLKHDIKVGVIDYLGVTSDVQRYLNQDGTVVVLPSYHEGMSRSLMEACALGRPIITTDIPGCRETVDDGINGYLVPKGDVQALVDAMIRFINLPEVEKKRMASASREKAERCFDVRDVIKIYDELLNA